MQVVPDAEGAVRIDLRIDHEETLRAERPSIVQEDKPAGSGGIEAVEQHYIHPFSRARVYVAGNIQQADIGQGRAADSFIHRRTVVEIQRAADIQGAWRIY